MKKISLLVGALLLVGCDKQPEPVKVEQPVKELTQEEKDRAFVDAIAKATTLDKAMLLASSKLGEEFQNQEKEQLSLGANGLIFWGYDHISWNMLEQVPSTTYKEFRKDPYSERGKKICATVNVNEIVVERDKDRVAYYATLVDPKDRFQIYQAILFKSTKGVVEDSKVKFCGIALENYQYRNIANKFSNSIFIMGLLDLPENK